MNKEKSKYKKPKNKLGYIDPSVAGIDIGSKLIHVSIPNKDGGVTVLEYGSTTPELHKIAKDLKQAGVAKGIMEATGVYWIPLYETLESPEYNLEPVLVDAKSVKNVPGRKTDVLDCQWIQVLYSSGLLRAAFRPPRERLTLRSITRIRKGIIKTRQRALLHIEKNLQLMNVKLSTVVSEIAGVSGFKIIRAIVKGEKDPHKLSKLRHKSCKKEEELFIAALSGNYQKDHLFGLEKALNQYDFSNLQLEDCDKRILEELETFPTITEKSLPLREKDKKENGKYRSARKPKKNSVFFDIRSVLWKKSGIDLTSLPGIEDMTALTIFSELGGCNVDSWESEKEFCSWLKLCPGNNVSGGKQRKSKHRPSVNPISQSLRMSSVASKSSKTGIGAFIRRICSRTDKPKGIKAGAHKLARTLYQMCKHGMTYVEKGEAYNERKYEKRVMKNLEKQAKRFGYKMIMVTE